MPTPSRPTLSATSHAALPIRRREDSLLGTYRRNAPIDRGRRNRPVTPSTRRATAREYEPTGHYSYCRMQDSKIVGSPWQP